MRFCCGHLKRTHFRILTLSWNHRHLFHKVRQMESTRWLPLILSIIVACDGSEQSRAIGNCTRHRARVVDRRFDGAYARIWYQTISRLQPDNPAAARWNSDGSSLVTAQCHVSFTCGYLNEDAARISPTRKRANKLTTTPLPELEPPAECKGFHGFLTGP